MATDEEPSLSEYLAWFICELPKDSPAYSRIKDLVLLLDGDCGGDGERTNERGEWWLALQGVLKGRSLMISVETYMRDRGACGA